MSMTGSLEDVLGRLYSLYMEDRIDVLNTEYFLTMLKHPNGELVFGPEDIINMLEMLRVAKEERDEF